MDGSALLLERFRNAANTGISHDGSERVIAVTYPTNVHLRLCHELCEYIVHNYLEKLEKDANGYVIVAQSFSCHAALTLYSKHGRYSPLPGRCLGIVLVNGFCSMPGPLWAHGLRDVLPFALQYQPPPWMVTNIFLGRGPDTSSMMRIVQKCCSLVKPWVLQARLKECFDTNTWSVWSDTSALEGRSVLCLHGLDDALVSRAAMTQRMKTSRRDIEFVGIEHGPHLLLQRFPEPCAKAIDKFARKREFQS